MALSHTYRAVANGARTDHPIPDLPFVDDAHLPLEDPDAIEAIGRHEGGQTWGRTDKCRDGGWVAFTTDADRHDLAWVVRWHPEHGRSVVLYRDEDASGAYMTYQEGGVLLFRAGGYWWNGTSWFRPSRVFDLARETYVDRPVPAAVTVSAADLLAGGGEATRGAVQAIAELDPDAHPYATASGRRWRDDLALWAAHRDGGRDLADCVVQLTAPELTADQLLSVAELAEVAGIAASTLRAYLARGENEVPLPQAVVGGRAMWSRPVAEDWAEDRRRSRDGVARTMADRTRENFSVGATEIWDYFTKNFLSYLWERPEVRKRFALRWRTQPAVRDLADALGWITAISLDRIVPMDDVAATIRRAFLWEFLDYQKLSRSLGDEEPPMELPVNRDVAQMLDWLVRHEPVRARHVVAEIVGEAERQLGISPEVSGRSLRRALYLDGTLADRNAYDEFLSLALPPKS